MSDDLFANLDDSLEDRLLAAGWRKCQHLGKTIWQDPKGKIHTEEEAFEMIQKEDQ